MRTRKRKSLTCLICGEPKLFRGCYCEKCFKDRRNQKNKEARAFIPKGKKKTEKKKEIRYSTFRVPKSLNRFIYNNY